MQGKFQMQVLPAVGHTVHEDSPDKVPFFNFYLHQYYKVAFSHFLLFFSSFFYTQGGRGARHFPRPQ